MNKETIRFMLNGEQVEIYANPAKSLLHLLRDDLGLTGTKEGCGQGECGACTVLLDDVAVNSCLVPAGKISGHSVITIEALSKDGKPDFVQEAFVEKGAVQCGFCTPGMVMSAHALLRQNTDPSPEEVKTAISGNLCRCTGYKQIEEAILSAAEKLKS
ncbi:MAG: (2Fe-2S)-binding protein [Firmicutes bacterium]|nr:(2Fe-2S)-binding protein [Bacillota bacterium]